MSTPGWAAAPNDVLRDPTLPLAAKGIFCILASHADRHGYAHPSIRTIAAEAGAGHSTVERHLDTLRTRGLITWETRPTRTGWVRHYRVWQPHEDVPPAASVPARDPATSATRPEGGYPTTGQGLPHHRPGGYPTTGTEEEPLNKNQEKNPPYPPPSEPSPAAGPNHPDSDPDALFAVSAAPLAEPVPIDDGFDSWWAAYPRKVAKPAARKAWRAALRRGVTAQEMLDGLRVHLPSLTARDAQFRPHPATWVNGDRWADPVEEAPAPRKASPWDPDPGTLTGWQPAAGHDVVHGRVEDERNGW